MWKFTKSLIQVNEALNELKEFYLKQMGAFFCMTVGAHQGCPYCLYCSTFFFRNPLWPSHLHLHQWETHKHPKLCVWMAASSTELQDLTNKLTMWMHMEWRQAMTQAKSWLATAAKQYSTCTEYSLRRHKASSTWEPPRKGWSFIADVCIRIAATASAVARLDRLWPSNTIRFTTKNYQEAPTVWIYVDSDCWHGELTTGIRDKVFEQWACTYPATPPNDQYQWTNLTVYQPTK